MNQYEKFKTILDLMSELSEGKHKIECEILKESINLTETLEDKLKLLANRDNFDKISEKTLLELLTTIKQCKKELDKFVPDEMTTTLN